MESEESRGELGEEQLPGDDLTEEDTQLLTEEEEEGLDAKKQDAEELSSELEISDNKADMEETEEEGTSDPKDDEARLLAEEDEGGLSMEEVDGLPLDHGDDEEDFSKRGTEDDEAMEEEEEEENGERPGAVEEDEEEEEPIEDDHQGHPRRNSGFSGIQTRKRTLSHSSSEDGPKRKVGRSAAPASGGGNQSSDGQKHDKYCWVCHRDSVQVNCKLCPRSYHVRCMNTDYPNAKIGQGDSSCPCPECVVVMNAETLEFRSEAMKQLTLDQLMGLLKNICLRMRAVPGCDPFIQPVDPSDAEDYFDYIVYPMDIETLEKNIKKRLYGSTEGFLADAQWLVHNSIVFNSASSQYTLAAKRLLKVCKQELTEIETCPECYTNAHEKPESWFVEACRRPHILVWAKLKGFPFWPAKAMKIKDNDVDVRFFGQHDRAWVSKKDCFLYSEEMPAPPPKKNGPLLAAIDELTAHVEKLKAVHGQVVFAPVKTQIGPQLSVEQIRRMLPEYQPPEHGGSLATAAAPAAPAAAKTAAVAGAAATTSAKPGNATTNNNNNNNNNNSVKVAPPTKKSPMTIRISSLKTNPTIVNISGENSPSLGEGSGGGGRVTRLTRKSSSAASSQQGKDNPSGESDAEQAPEEPTATESNNQNEDNDLGEEEEGETVPEEKHQAPQEEEEAEEESTATAASPALPKGSEILASALGGGGAPGAAAGGALRRSTRGMSRSGEGGEAGVTPTSGMPQLEKRLTRGALKTTSTHSEEGNNGDSVSDEQPSDAVLEAMGLSKKTEKKETPSPSGGGMPKARVVKEEPAEDAEMEDSDAASPARATKTASHNALMEQLTMPTSVKHGYRFNLSKDISISAVDGGAMAADQEEQLNAAVNRSVAQPARRVNPGGVQRSVPQGIPMNAVRPRLPPNTVVNGQQRVFTGQQLRQMVRNARPQHILNPRTGQIVRSTGVATGGGNRAVSMLPVRGQQQQQQFHAQQKSAAKEAVMVDTSSLVNPVQGPITLPGGTITVTPLTSLIAGVPISTTATFEGGVNGASSQQVAVALKAANTAGSATSIGILNVQQAAAGVNSKAGVKAAAGVTAQQRRNLMVSIPPSVNMHLQNLTKTMSDLVKSTVEQITLEIVEFCQNSQGKADTSRLQVEVDKLQKQLKQEVTDIKHNNDIAMRELRMTMENDKKRAMQEMKRQMEAEKQKAIEETKKKQWCASCGREALFYCCWNTSYCGYPCQEEHWPSHMASCSQSSNTGGR